MLWIAYKILYLCSLKQLMTCMKASSDSCESLTKSCIFALWNNAIGALGRKVLVVNRLQNLVSLLFETTAVGASIRRWWLWIAYKILYLCSLKQPYLLPLYFAPCCESLTKSCIFALWNNNHKANKVGALVVNRLQNLVSLLFETTYGRIWCRPS